MCSAFIISCAACQQTDRSPRGSSNVASRAGPTGRTGLLTVISPEGCPAQVASCVPLEHKTEMISSLRQIACRGELPYGLTYTSESAGLRNQLIQRRSTLAESKPEFSLSRVLAQSRPLLQARPTLPLHQVQVENAALTLRLCPAIQTQDQNKHPTRGANARQSVDVMCQVGLDHILCQRISRPTTSCCCGLANCTKSHANGFRPFCLPIQQNDAVDAQNGHGFPSCRRLILQPRDLLP